MATYSAELESGLGKLIENAKAVLSLCNASRTDFEATLAEGTYWRDYSKGVFCIFDTINAMERAALELIEAVDFIRKENDSCAEVAEDEDEQEHCQCAK